MLLLVLLFCVLSVSSFRKTDLMPRSVVNLRKTTAPRRAATGDAALVSGAMQREPNSLLGRLNVSSVLDHTTIQEAIQRAKKRDPLIETKAAKNKRLKDKAYNLMQQFLFASQELLWPIQAIVDQYATSTPYRMAFIFDQMQLLVHGAASIVSQESKSRPGSKFGGQQPLPIAKRVQIYWALMRRNIDGTYMVDYVLKKVSKSNKTAKLINNILRQDLEIEMMQQQMSAHTQKAANDHTSDDIDLI